MKGTDKIIAHIQADAKAEADAILAQAEKQCAAIRDEYAEKAREAYSARIRDGVKECEESAGNKDRIVQMESKKEILALKQEMVSASFCKAKELLLNMPDEDYFAFLVKLAVKASDNGSGEIVLNKTDRVKFGNRIAQAANETIGGGKLSLSEDTGDFSGGLIIRNGRIEANNSIELLVDMSREEMSGKVAGILFE
ncbi:MAG: V-type ATP synthase subunit E family protein [Eubacteriales bacterium]|nr:V-type ATP synthase subunit E family protein [Eubacteriales bacterium]